MTQILDDTSSNWLVRWDDGTTEMVAKSNMNKLLMEHDLWGLLRDGTEILTIPPDGKKPRVTLIPDHGAKSYRLQVADYERITIGPHQKPRLVDVILAGKRSNEVRSRLVDLYDEIRESRVRSVVTSAFAERPPFVDAVEDTADGWLIHGYLLLTWEGDFYHPNTTTYDRGGNVIGEGMSEAAYNVSIAPPAGENREIRLNEKDFRLTNSELQFVAKALWAVTSAPKGVGV